MNKNEFKKLSEDEVFTLINNLETELTKSAAATEKSEKALGAAIEALNQEKAAKEKALTDLTNETAAKVKALTDLTNANADKAKAEDALKLEIAAKEAAEDSVAEINEQLASMQKSTESERATATHNKVEYDVLAAKIRVPKDMIASVGSDTISRNKLAEHPALVKHLVETKSGILRERKPTEK